MARTVAGRICARATVRANLALADGFLYARNSDTRDNMLVCLDLRP